MHHFLYVCNQTKIHISGTIAPRAIIFGQSMDVDDPKVDLEDRGQRSRSRVTGVQVSQKVKVKNVIQCTMPQKNRNKAGGLTSTSSCIFFLFQLLNFMNENQLKFRQGKPILKQRTKQAYIPIGKIITTSKGVVIIYQSCCRQPVATVSRKS